MGKVVSVGLDAAKVTDALAGSSRAFQCLHAKDLGGVLTWVDEGAPDLLVVGGEAADAASMVEELVDEPALLGTPFLGWAVEGSVGDVSRLLALGVQVVSGGDLAFRKACEDALDAREGRTMRVEPGTELRAATGDVLDLHGRRVLVADDDPAVAWYFADILRAEGCDVDEAVDGEAALDRAFRTVPDLVLADIRMPRLDGLRLCRSLRMDPILADIPVVLLSWKEDWLRRAEEDGVGATAYLAKKSTPEEVLECVRGALGPHDRTERRLRSPGAIRGRLDVMSPYRLLRVACAAKPDGRLTLQCHLRAYELHLRDGAPRSATCSARDGSVLRGTPAIVSLLGERAGRFTLDAESSRIPGELTGSLHQQIASCVARAREHRIRPTRAPVSVPAIPAAAPSPPPAPQPPAMVVRTAPEPAVRTVPIPPRPFVPRVVIVTPRTPEPTLPLSQSPTPRPAVPARPPRPARVATPRAWKAPMLRYAGVAAIAALGILVGAGVHVLRAAEEAPAHATAPHAR